MRQENSIYTHGENFAPSDSVTFGPSRIYVGGTGNDATRDTDGGPIITWTAVPAGSVLPALAVQVMATGTTATNIIRMF